MKIHSLKGKKILITGASGGIGSSMAILFAEHGGKIGLHYHTNRDQARILERSITESGGDAACFKANLLAKNCAALVDKFIDRFGGIDVLINNAGGVLGCRHFAELDEADWKQTMALNAEAAFFLSQRAFSFMKDNGGGRIVNISSISVKYGGSPQTLHYAAAKAALEAVTIGLARAGAPHKILVNAVRGGFIDTALHQKLGAKNIKKRIGLIPLKRAGKPEDISRMALFLASEAGDFITGETFTVGGGD